VNPSGFRTSSETVSAKGRSRVELTLFGWIYLWCGPAFTLAYLLGRTGEWPLFGWAAIGLTHGLLLRWNLWGLHCSLRFLSPRCTLGGSLEGEIEVQRQFFPGAGRALRFDLKEFPDGLLESLEVKLVRATPRIRRFRLQPRSFGRYTLGLVRVSSLYPFRLWEIVSDFRQPPLVDAVIWPQRHRLPLRLRQSERSGVAKRGTILRPLPERGLEVRPYDSGDSPRDICWKSTARLGHLQVRPRPMAAIRPRFLVLHPERRLWKRTQDFWKMVLVAFELVQRSTEDHSLKGVVIGSELFPLRSRRETRAALDAIACLKPQFVPRTAPPRVSPTIHLRPAREGGLSLFDERYRELHRVS
jgi:uncharacterized protein (DUF58 family)